MEVTIANAVDYQEVPQADKALFWWTLWMVFSVALGHLYLIYRLLDLCRYAQRVWWQWYTRVTSTPSPRSPNRGASLAATETKETNCTRSSSSTARRSSMSAEDYLARRRSSHSPSTGSWRPTTPRSPLPPDPIVEERMLTPPRLSWASTWPRARSTLENFVVRRVGNFKDSWEVHDD